MRLTQCVATGSVLRMSKATDELRAYMQAHDLTQTKFADQVPMSKEQLSRIMNGLTPGPLLRHLIAVRFDLDVADLSSWQ